MASPQLLVEMTRLSAGGQAGGNPVLFVVPVDTPSRSLPTGWIDFPNASDSTAYLLQQRHHYMMLRGRQLKTPGE